MQTLATRPSGWVGYCICKISHLLDGGGNLLGYDVMKSNFQDLNWLEFCGIVSAVKSFINKLQNASCMKRYLDPTNNGKWEFVMTVKKCMVVN